MTEALYAAQVTAMGVTVCVAFGLSVLALITLLVDVLPRLESLGFLAGLSTGAIFFWFLAILQGQYLQ